MLEGFYKSGRCRAIGVSNYEQHHLQELLDCAVVKPMVNQVSLMGCPACLLPEHIRHPRRFICEPHAEMRLSCFAQFGIAFAIVWVLNSSVNHPSLVQIEVHPRYPQKELRAFCQHHSIAVMAYASLGCGDLLTHPTVRLIAYEVDRTPAQVRLLYLLYLAAA